MSEMARQAILQTSAEERRHVAAALLKAVESGEVDKVDFDAACDVAASLLREQATLPPSLARFAAGVLDGSITRPKGKDGYATYLRDWELAERVAMVAKERGLPAYVNEGEKETAVRVVSKETRTSLDVVQHAFKRFKPRGSAKRFKR